MGKVILNIVLLFLIGNVKVYSQTIKLNGNDKYNIRKIGNNSHYLLQIQTKKKCFTFRLKELRMPKKINKIYTFDELKKLQKAKGKMFSAFEGLIYGSGFFIINDKYYDNLGSSID